MGAYYAVVLSVLSVRLSVLCLMNKIPEKPRMNYAKTRVSDTFINQQIAGVLTVLGNIVLDLRCQ